MTSIVAGIIAGIRLGLVGLGLRRRSSAAAARSSVVVPAANDSLYFLVSPTHHRYPNGSIRPSLTGVAASVYAAKLESAYQRVCRRAIKKAANRRLETTHRANKNGAVAMVQMAATIQTLQTLHTWIILIPRLSFTPAHRRV